MKGFEKMCADCAELREKGGVMMCHEMWDKPCSSLDECPLGLTCEEVVEAQTLTEEQKKTIKEAKNTDTHEIKKKVERKPRENPEKENIVANIANYLENSEFCAKNVVITNKTREIVFSVNENDYKMQITATRKPKK